MAIVLIIRFLLNRENKKRDMEGHDDTYDDVYIERPGPDGKLEQVKIDKVSHIVLGPCYTSSERCIIGIFGSHR